MSLCCFKSTYMQHSAYYANFKVLKGALSEIPFIFCKSKTKIIHTQLGFL